MNTNTLRNMLAATVALFISMFALPAMAQDEIEAYVLESADGKTLLTSSLFCAII